MALGLTCFSHMYGTWWHYLMVATTVAVLPCIILFVVFQKYFIQGIVITGVKGEKKYVETKNRETQNYLRAVEFKYPKWIPCRIWMPPATWKKYGTDLEKIVQDHPRIIITGRDLINDPIYQKGNFIDTWGCTWKNIAEGMAGQVIGHPLKDWQSLRNFQPPDPLKFNRIGKLWNWEKIKKSIEKDKKEGRLTSGGCDHSFMFQILYDLRGFENFMIDVATDNPRLKHLINVVLNHNQRLIDKWLELGVELMAFGDDLGNQDRLAISPGHWRKYLKPCYKQMYSKCRAKGTHVYMHSDGHILEIIPDLIECGVTIINPQIGANGLEGLIKTCKEKVCVDLDLDRQLLPLFTPQQIEGHVQKAIEALGSKKGGLMLFVDCEPIVPLKNIIAICDAFEKYCFE